MVSYSGEITVDRKLKSFQWLGMTRADNTWVSYWSWLEYRIKVCQSQDTNVILMKGWCSLWFLFSGIHSGSGFHCNETSNLVQILGKLDQTFSIYLCGSVILQACLKEKQNEKVVFWHLLFYKLVYLWKEILFVLPQIICPLASFLNLLFSGDGFSPEYDFGIFLLA